MRQTPKRDQQHRAEVLFQRLEEYRTERHKLIQQLEEMDTQARSLQLEYNSLRNSIAPIASLPDKVLAKIFEAGAHLEVQKRLYYEIKKRLHFSVLVSHVARSWRNIALATPRLWATIQCFKSMQMIHYKHPYPETGRERTAAFLVRSRSSPVDIYIESFRAEDFEPQFVQLLCHHFGHCRHLSIAESQAEDLRVALAHFSSQPTPILESFQLGVNSYFFELEEPLFPFGAPHLKIAHINAIHPSTLHFCLTALQSVTSLMLLEVDLYSGDDRGYMSFRDCLMNLPFLNHLELQAAYADPILRPSPNFPPVALTALKVLHASSRSTYGLLDILGQFIHAESLTVLTLQGPSGEIENALEVHFPSLQHLILLDLTTEVLGFGIFSQLPSIQQLTCQFERYVLHQSCVIGDVLAALEDGNTGHRIPCPRLHTVAVSASDTAVDILALTSKISALQNNGTPIRKLMFPQSLLSEPGANWEGIAELRKLVEIGDITEDQLTPFASKRLSTFY